jgi:hypothetical protein
MAEQSSYYFLRTISKVKMTITVINVLEIPAEGTIERTQSRQTDGTRFS